MPATPHPVLTRTQARALAVIGGALGAPVDFKTSLDDFSDEALVDAILAAESEFCLSLDVTDIFTLETVGEMIAIVDARLHPRRQRTDPDILTFPDSRIVRRRAAPFPPGFETPPVWETPARPAATPRPSARPLVDWRALLGATVALAAFGVTVAAFRGWL